MSVKGLYLVGVAALIGCSTAGGKAASPSSALQKAAFLSAEEIADAHADVTTAYDAIARLRPNWLLPHGGYATVFLDGQPYGDVGSLRNIPGNNVAEIRYYDGTQGAAMFGLRGGNNGVIEVRTRSS